MASATIFTMREIDSKYISLVNRILEEGDRRPDRTGTGTIQIPYHSMELDLSEDFPVLSLKKLAFKQVMTELNWFLLGRNDIEFLHHHNCHIWDGDFERYQRECKEQNVSPSNTFGFSYGRMWHHQEGFTSWVRSLIVDPYSRRHVIYNGDKDNKIQPLRTALQPCHDLFEFNLHKGKLNLHFHMRSVDVGLGLPFNIASYAALLRAVASKTSYSVGKMYISLFNVHIYLDHVNLLKDRISQFEIIPHKGYMNPIGLDFQLVDPVGEFDFVLNAKLINYHHSGDLKLPLST